MSNAATSKSCFFIILFKNHKNFTDFEAFRFLKEINYITTNISGTGFKK